MTNGKKKIGLIALLSCVLTATVAFAAYTGYNYIQGKVDVVGNPFKMVFATGTDDQATVFDTEGGTIYASTNATVSPAQNGPIAGDITVGAFSDGGSGTPTGPHSTITGFNVTLKQVGDKVVYTFAIKNTGGSTAYLSKITIAESSMPVDSSGNTVQGLRYTVKLSGKDADDTEAIATATSDNGGETDLDLSGRSALDNMIAVKAGGSITASLTIECINSSLLTAWNGDAYGATVDLGGVTIEWSAVPIERNSSNM